MINCLFSVPPQTYSFYPFIRLLLPKIDRERDSYGIQIPTMGQLYIRAFNFSAKSVEAKSLTTPQGFNSSNTVDYADVIFNVIKNRCPRQCSLSIAELNAYLDTIASPKTKRAEVELVFTKIITSTTAKDQKWIVRIILKKLNLGIAERRILSVYHSKAYSLYERMSLLSRVCELVDTGKADEADVDTEAVALFQPLRCMLCEQAKLVRLPFLLRDQNLYVELKMDGERFQVHKQGNDYRYFSRNDEFTDKFGAKATGSTFSASLDRKLDPSVKSIILDGEMLVWDQVERRFLAKGDNVDARNLKQNHNLLQVYCAFDVLFLNGESLIRKPYLERIRLLDKVVHVDEHVVVVCERRRVDSVEEILAFFNRAIDQDDEGIILKGQDSVYRPGARNGSGWFKLKPDYVEGLISDLDLLIIGATRNAKGFVESFVLGVAIKQVVEGVGDPEENMTFQAVSMVRSGFDRSQWRELNATLSRHWVRGMEKCPQYLEFGNCKPHCWIEPKQSVVLQVKATELNRSDSFRTQYTLRFPRVTAIRADKPWYDSCLLTDFEALLGTSGGGVGGVATGGRVQKITKRHAQMSDVSVVKVRGTAAKNRRVTELTYEEDVVPVDSVLEGKEICILSTKRGGPSIRELGNIIKRHAGVVVKNPGPTTFVCVAGDLIATVNSYARTQLYDIVHVDWVARELAGRELTAMPPLKPYDMVATRTQTKERFKNEFDKYNDSYVHEIRDNEELKMILDSMQVECYEQLLERELIAFEEEHILGDGNDQVAGHVNLFSSIYGFFMDSPDDHMQMIFRSRRGIIVREVAEATHLFVGGSGINIGEDELPKECPKNVKFIGCDYIVACIKKGQLVDEGPYLIMSQ